MNELQTRYEKLLGTKVTFPKKKDCLRINPLLAPPDIVDRLAKVPAKLTPVPFLPGAYWYTSERSLGATPEYLLGYYYLQEAASQLPVLVLNPPKDAKVLDMAAAPGSKTTQLASHMNNSGVIFALELKTPRMASLVENLERCGVKNAMVYRKDARFVPELGVSFSHILLDAPCSGNPVIEPEFFNRKSVEGILEMQRLQRELIKAGMKVLAPGGVFVYSTCSLEPEENEEQVAWMLSTYPELTIVPTELTIGDEAYTTILGKKLPAQVKNARRLWPHKTGTQAFFVAKFVKKK